MKPTELYHGSGKKLEGNYLKPRKADDLGRTKSNSYLGVYASDLKNQAIAMGIVSGKTIPEVVSLSGKIAFFETLASLINIEPFTVVCLPSSCVTKAY